MELRWPGIKLRQTFGKFQEGVTTITYSESLGSSATDVIPASQLQEDYNGAVEAYWSAYGRSWSESKHAATGDYYTYSETESMKSLSTRIQELVAQMDSVAKEEGTYDGPKAEEVVKMRVTKK
jgi:hypothetical protein